MEPLKNIFNRNSIEKLATLIQKEYPNFLKDQFLQSIFDKDWEKLELKERIGRVSLVLGQFLPNDYTKALDILLSIHTQFDGIFHFIFPDFVAVYGLEYYDLSLDGLKRFTPQSSSEFAIRTFLIKYPQTIDILKLWTQDKNEHIRRLASEGCRPRLPWAITLQEYKKDPTKVIEVLELLQDDTSKYVQKSVANNLNDISKDHPNIVKKLFKRWYLQSKSKDWIVKHGARTLLKQGDREILDLFGFSADGIIVSDFKVDDLVKMEEYLNFSFKIKSNKNLEKLRIEYKLGFVRQNHKMGYKIFKISEKNIDKTFIYINKSHHFKYITTRKYYDGIHTLTIVVNGKEFLTKKFRLEI